MFRRVSNVFHRRGRKKSQGKDEDGESGTKTEKKEKKIRFSLRHRKKKKQKAELTSDGVDDDDDNRDVEHLEADIKNKSGSSSNKTSLPGDLMAQDGNEAQGHSMTANGDDTGQKRGAENSLITGDDETVTATTATSLGSSQPTKNGSEGGKEPRAAPHQSQPTSALHSAEVHSHTASHDPSSNKTGLGRPQNNSDSGGGDVNVAFEDSEDTQKHSNDIVNDGNSERVMGKNHDNHDQMAKDTSGKISKEAVSNEDSSSTSKDQDLKSAEGVYNGAFNGDDSMEKIPSPLNASSKSSSVESVMSVTSGSSAMDIGNEGDVPTSLVPTGKKGKFCNALHQNHGSLSLSQLL